MKLSIFFEYFLLAAGIAVVLFFSTYRLSESPAIWYDEGFYTQVSMNLDLFGKQVLQVAPQHYVSTQYVTVGYPLLYPVSIFYRWFGVGVAQGRAVMVIYVLAFAAAAYYLIRKLFGSWIAAWTLLLLASFPILYGDGKSVLGEVPGVFYATLCFIFLLLLERSSYRNAWAYLGVGLCAGLCVVTKPIFILLLPALLLAWLFRFKKIPLHWGGFILAVVAFIVPVLIWMHLQFGGDTSPALVLAMYETPYHVANILAQVFGNIKRFFTESTPMYTAATVVAWLWSMYIRTKRKEHVTTTEVALFFFCLIILAAYLRLEGWYRYFFPATILALLFLPQSLADIFSYFSGMFGWLCRMYIAPTAIVAVLVAGQLYQLMQDSYVAQYYNSTKTKELSIALRALGPQTSIFLYDVPELTILLPSQNYYQYLAPSPYKIGVEQLTVLNSGTPAYAIVSEGDYATSTALFSRYAFMANVHGYDILKRK